MMITCMDFQMDVVVIPLICLHISFLVNITLKEQELMAYITVEIQNKIAVMHGCWERVYQLYNNYQGVHVTFLNKK